MIRKKITWEKQEKEGNMGKKEKRGLSMDWEQTWESSVSHCAPMTAA